MAVCPCGSGIKAGLSDVVYVTQAVLDAAGSAYGGKGFALIDPLVGRTIDLTALCAGDPPAAPPPSVSWFTKPLEYLDEIQAAAVRWQWSQWCQCAACPPIAGCTGANYRDIVPTDGFLHDIPSLQYELDAYGGQDVYVQRSSDGHCFGLFNGVGIDWNTDATYDPNGGVTICNYGGGGCVGYNARPTLGFGLRLYFGAGTGGGQSYPLALPSASIATPPTMGVCDPTTVCTAIAPIETTLEQLRIMVSQLSYNAAGTGGAYAINIPGVAGTITGTLNEVLSRALSALVGPSPSQLTLSSTTAITTSGSILLAGESYCEVTMDTVPSYYGVLGTTAPVYVGKGGQPGPGWVHVMTGHGRADYHKLASPSGVRFLIPPDATELLVELNPGVHVSLLLYDRAV